MIIRADARHIPLVDGCVQCVVTSPPYWGLRDYGNGDQIGLEPTPAAYVAALVSVFREVWRVLRDDGTVWLNLGDSYARQAGDDSTKKPDNGAIRTGRSTWELSQFKTGINRPPEGLKAKDLVGIPWRVAFALQADGWYLRSDIIWHKPNPMPESVTDRPTKAHEYVFLLAKSDRYYYDAAAIAERLAMEPHAPGNLASGRLGSVDGSVREPDRVWGLNGTRNKRSVWTVNTLPYAGAHFATMPEALIEPCIIAGCPVGSMVFDPFLGSGTVGAVAERLSRRWVGTDLSYHHLATKRTSQRGLIFSEPR
jgi:site-specific DNA-methyltransferase (adenine-specific)